MSDGENFDFPGPVAPPSPTERDGLTVGDEVLVNGRWPAIVRGFSALACDVHVQWTGKRPSAVDESTVCRSHADVVPA